MLFLLFNLDWLNQPKELYPYIIPYYILQLFSVVFTMLFNSFKQFSDGTTDTLTPMYVMLSANVVNIIGNYFLIYGHGGFPELGLTGAGISTLFSRISNAGRILLALLPEKEICGIRQRIQTKRHQPGKYPEPGTLGFAGRFPNGCRDRIFQSECHYDGMDWKYGSGGLPGRRCHYDVRLYALLWYRSGCIHSGK